MQRKLQNKCTKTNLENKLNKNSPSFKRAVFLYKYRIYLDMDILLYCTASSKSSICFIMRSYIFCSRIGFSNFLFILLFTIYIHIKLFSFIFVIISFIFFSIFSFFFIMWSYIC